MGQRTAGDLLFETYAREWGYELSDHEPDLGTGKRPDYLLGRGGEQCVIEVKQFAAGTSSFPAHGGSTDLATVLKPIRSQLREAARQLKEMVDLGVPLVAVLTNPLRASVILGEREMVWAMYGDPVVRMAIDPEIGAAVGEPEHGVGRNGRLARDHQYISAVAVIGESERAADWYEEMGCRYADRSREERWARLDEARDRGECPDGSYRYARVFKTLSPTAVPLPDAFFAGDSDCIFEPNDEGTAYVQVRGRDFG
jgi:hypothetical protein